MNPSELSSEDMNTQAVIDQPTKYRGLSPIELCVIVASLTMTITLVIAGAVQ